MEKCMKRFRRMLATALALFLCATPGLAVNMTGDVLYAAHCEDYVGLYAAPAESAPLTAHIPRYAGLVYLDAAENGFCRVAFMGATGYAPAGMLETLYSYAGDVIDLSAAQRYNVNLFLSNFSEQEFMRRSGVYDDYDHEDWQLNDFAVRHILLNRPDSVQRGKYAGGYSVRVSAEEAAGVAQKYFGRTPYDPAWSAYAYRDGYYYLHEEELPGAGGFTCLDEVIDLGGGRIGVYFESIGAGFTWNNDVCYYVPEQARTVYPFGARSVGFAVIDLSGGTLDERSAWSLEYWAYAGRQSE